MVRAFVFCLVFTASSFLFYLFPEIDIYTSNLFYDASKGFYLRYNPIVRFIHQAVPVLCVLTAMVVGYLALRKYQQIKSFQPGIYKRYIYFVLVCTLGAGLVVHHVVKDNFNRARPNAIHLFGGKSNFTPAFVVSDQCTHNCSFVSGHSAAGFMFFALAFLHKDRIRRRQFTILGLALGSLFGMIRIMEGGHYLSDVVFAGFIMYMVSYSLARILKPAV